jgi:hypothetical protein
MTQRRTLRTITSWHSGESGCAMPAMKREANERARCEVAMRMPEEEGSYACLGRTLQP